MLVENTPYILIDSLLLTLLLTHIQIGLKPAGDKYQAWKFSESAWKATWYIASVAAGGYLIYYCDWWPETINCWKGFPFVGIEMA